jgi:Inheritance of peroxisomes protein 1
LGCWFRAWPHRGFNFQSARLWHGHKGPFNRYNSGKDGGATPYSVPFLLPLDEARQDDQGQRRLSCLCSNFLLRLPTENHQYLFPVAFLPLHPLNGKGCSASLSSMSAPSTPEPAPPRALLSQSHPTIRRVHTLPPSLVERATSPSHGNHAADTIESLFTIHFAKVVAFEVAASRSRPGASSGLRGADADGSDGTLPWASPTERTLAAGTFRVVHADEFDVESSFGHLGRCYMRHARTP